MHHYAACRSDEQNSVELVQVNSIEHSAAIFLFQNESNVRQYDNF